MPPHALQDMTGPGPGLVLADTSMTANTETRRPMAAVELEVLDRAITDMGAWISLLPDASELRWSFLQARRELEVDRVALRSASGSLGRRR